MGRSPFACRHLIALLLLVGAGQSVGQARFTFQTTASAQNAVSEASPGSVPNKPPAYPGGTILPIDLPTALRLVNAANPTVALARERVRAAYERQRQAEVLWMPNLTAGATYLRHDGQVQNAAGLVFTTSKSSLFVGGGAVADVNVAEVLFAPLVARQLTQGQAAQARAVTIDVQLDVALTYM